jgi:glucokinase
MCGCGNKGCFMSWTSGSMVPRHVRNRIATGEKTIMTTYVDDPIEITMEHIDKAFSENDYMAVKAIDQMVKYLAIWIYNLYVFMNINCFVFGGGLLEMKAPIMERVRKEFDRYNQNDKPVYFKIAELGNRTGIIGASELIFR